MPEKQQQKNKWLFGTIINKFRICYEDFSVRFIYSLLCRLHFVIDFQLSYLHESGPKLRGGKVLIFLGARYSKGAPVSSLFILTLFLSENKQNQRVEGTQAPLPPTNQSNIVMANGSWGRWRVWEGPGLTQEVEPEGLVLWPWHHVVDV